MRSFFKDAFLEFLSPRRCVLCHRIPDRGTKTRRRLIPYGLCLDCRLERYLCLEDSEIARGASEGLLGDAYASFLYEGALKEAVLALKYQGRKDLAAYFARWMWLYREKSCRIGGAQGKGRALASLFSGKERLVLVPVPISRKRLKRRGYNQAALMAEALSEASGAPMKELLERTGDTRALKGLGAAEREKELGGRIRLKEGLLLEEDCTFLIIDDILTTGATFRTCERAILAHLPGARVYFWAFARDRVGASPKEEGERRIASQEIS